MRHTKGAKPPKPWTEGLVSAIQAGLLDWMTERQLAEDRPVVRLADLERLVGCPTLLPHTRPAWNASVICRALEALVRTGQVVAEQDEQGEWGYRVEVEEGEAKSWQEHRGRMVGFPSEAAWKMWRRSQGRLPKRAGPP